MPFLTEDPVLHIEESAIRTIDPQETSDLFGLWSAFSKCARITENGKRLEYLSWRLLNRQTLCCPSRSNASSKAQTTASRSQKLDQVPELSSSLDSLSSVSSHEDGGFFVGKDMACDAQKSNNASPVNLENLVMSIKNTQDISVPLPSLERVESRPQTRGHDDATAPRPSSPRPMNTESSTSTVATDCFNSPPTSAASSATSGLSNHSIIRGFEPGNGSSSYTSKSQLACTPTPILKSSSTRSFPQKKKNTMFTLGASSGEDDSSFRDRMSPRSRADRRSNESQASSYKKQASFDEQVTEIRTFQLPTEDSDEAIETDDDDESSDDTSENAIEEDDDEDAWEDDVDENREEPKTLQFPRVDSTANLTSRRSMLTLMREEEKSGKLQNSRSSPALRRSRTSTPNGPSMPASPTEESPMETRHANETQAKPIIVTTSNTHPNAAPQALSPRTTRRNMLAGELSESLRKQLLWERQQRNIGSNMGMKRAHTSTDVRNIQIQQQRQNAAAQSTQPAPPFRDATSTSSWNQYFDYGLGEYHQKGW